MEGKTLVKLCKDCKIIDKKFTSTDVDLIFAKVATKGQKKITYDQFEKALEAFATKKGTDADTIKNAILSHGGP